VVYIGTEPSVGFEHDRTIGSRSLSEPKMWTTGARPREQETTTEEQETIPPGKTGECLNARLAGRPAEHAQQPVRRPRRVHLPQEQQQQLQRGAVVQADRPQTGTHDVARRRAAATAAQVQAVPIQGILQVTRACQRGARRTLLAGLL
jgi:hypothetical protein